jgi:predicted AAA+ superfamily ATPase
MEAILKTILAEWRERNLPEIIKRDIDIPLPPVIKLIRKATVVTGFRRTGKTYLLFALIKKLLQRYSKEEVVYLNFEDERIPQRTEVLTSLIPVCQAFFGKKPKFLFLDEIQNIPLWSKWVRRILDNQDIHLFLSGSSSKLSSLEIPTELGGRSWEIKVYPLNFREFLRFKGFYFNLKEINYSEDKKAQINHYFDEYLFYGGLPEVALTPKEKKIELLQNYFQTVIKREIIDRYQIKNELLIKTILKLLLNSSYFTLSKLFNSLKSLGFKVGKTTLNNYLEHIESSYFLYSLFFYSPSVKNQLFYPRKPYFIDNGFITALSTKFSKNYGRLLENLVFWDFKKEGEEVFYYKDEKNNEVDFVLLEDQKVKGLYQVCFDLSDFETQEREIKSLLKAGKKLNCQNLNVITSKKIEKVDERVKVMGMLEFLKSD